MHHDFTWEKKDFHLHIFPKCFDWNLGTWTLPSLIFENQNFCRNPLMFFLHDNGQLLLDQLEWMSEETIGGRSAATPKLVISWKYPCGLCTKSFVVIRCFVPIGRIPGLSFQAQYFPSRWSKSLNIFAIVEKCKLAYRRRICKLHCYLFNVPIYVLRRAMLKFILTRHFYPQHRPETLCEKIEKMKKLISRNNISRAILCNCLYHPARWTDAFNLISFWMTE